MAMFQPAAERTLTVVEALAQFVVTTTFCPGTSVAVIS